MGNSHSRSQLLPPEINLLSYRQMNVDKWTEKNIIDIHFNKRLNTADTTTLGKANIIMTANHIKDFFSKISLRPLRFLEIQSGNCIPSSIIKGILETTTATSPAIELKWLASDLVDYKTRVKDIPFVKLNTIDAVAMHGSESNILIAVSPQPGIGIGNYSDYYACHDFIEQTKEGEEKYIVIVGELGAGDGSQGMYKYMLENPELELVKRKMLFKYSDGVGDVEKELFIFKIIRKYICNNCKKSPPDVKELRVCSGCQKIRYCSIECQRADWPIHRKMYEHPKKIGGYYEKYLKYKMKYISLKKSII
jgi:hypothetical protein